MDNDNKIAKVQNDIHKEVLLFLGDELDKIHQTSKGNNYDIVQEYAKTKKNRSPFVVIVLLVTLLAVLLTAFIMQRVISFHNKEIAVSLEEFDDLNLRNLLNSVSSVQTSYDNAIKNKEQIQVDWNKQIAAIQSERENDIYVVDSMHLKDGADYANRISVINANTAEKINAVNEEYQEKMAKAEKQIEDFKKQLDKFDAAQVLSAKENENAIDSTRQVQQLEIQKISREYEERISELENSMQQLRKKSTEDMRKAVNDVVTLYQARIDVLDPTIHDTKADEIIGSAYEPTESEKRFNASAAVENNGITDERFVDYLENYQDVYGKYRYLDETVSSIPQENSIPSYVASSRALVEDMGQLFTDTTVSYYEEKNLLEKEIQKKQEEKIIQQELYENVLDNVMTVAKTNAVVLSASSAEDIQIFVSPKARYLISEEGADAEFKADKTVKGKIFAKEDGSYVFVQSADKDGNFTEFDISLVLPGLSVKILSK